MGKGEKILSFPKQKSFEYVEASLPQSNCRKLYFDLLIIGFRRQFGSVENFRTS